MNWFTKSLAEPATVPQQNPAPSSELEQVERAYQESERFYTKACNDVLHYQQANRQAGSVMIIDGRAYVRTNALGLNRELSLLCHARELAKTKRSQLLSARADALRRAGKVK